MSPVTGRKANSHTIAVTHNVKSNYWDKLTKPQVANQSGQNIDTAISTNLDKNQTLPYHSKPKPNSHSASLGQNQPAISLSLGQIQTAIQPVSAKTKDRHISQGNNQTAVSVWASTKDSRICLGQNQIAIPVNLGQNQTAKSVWSGPMPKKPYLPV